jgi:glycosyltransferase involved in cell wall biosynthesis
VTPPRPTVSVIIASNRGGPYLATAVESVKQQTVPVDEVLLIDDGAPAPGLGGVAAQLGIDYIRQSSAGVSAARNRGVEQAKGEWIALLDDDDVWHPEKIEEQLRALTSFPTAVACYSDLTVIDPEGRPVTEIEAPTGSSRQLMGMGNGVPPINTLLIHRDTYLTVGGCDPALRTAEDIDLVLRLLQIGEFAKAPRSLTGYRKYPGQVTSDGFANLAGYLLVVRRLIQRATRNQDRDTARVLRSHLRRTLPGMADWGAMELLQRLKRGNWVDAGAVARWGFRNTRLAFPPAIVRTAVRRVTRPRTEKSQASRPE